MTTAQYLAALRKLGLTPSSKLAAEALGVSLRQAQYYAAGRPIPAPVAKLLRLMVDVAAGASKPAARA